MYSGLDSRPTSPFVNRIRERIGARTSDVIPTSSGQNIAHTASTSRPLGSTLPAPSAEVFVRLYEAALDPPRGGAQSVLVERAYLFLLGSPLFARNVADGLFSPERSTLARLRVLLLPKGEDPRSAELDLAAALKAEARFAATGRARLRAAALFHAQRACKGPPFASHLGPRSHRWNLLADLYHDLFLDTADEDWVRLSTSTWRIAIADETDPAQRLLLLDQLANGFNDWSTTVGVEAYLVTAIDLWREARITAEHESVALEPSIVSNAGEATARLGRRRSSLALLSEAIEILGDAARRLTSAQPGRMLVAGQLLMRLATAHSWRAALLEDPRECIGEHHTAIECARSAIAHTEEGSVYRAGRIVTLCGMWLGHYRRTGDAGFVEDAIGLITEAAHDVLHQRDPQRFWPFRPLDEATSATDPVFAACSVAAKIYAVHSQVADGDRALVSVERSIGYAIEALGRPSPPEQTVDLLLLLTSAKIAEWRNRGSPQSIVDATRLLEMLEKDAAAVAGMETNYLAVRSDLHFARFVADPSAENRLRAKREVSAALSKSGPRIDPTNAWYLLMTYGALQEDLEGTSEPSEDQAWSIYLPFLDRDLGLKPRDLFTIAHRSASYAVHKSFAVAPENPETAWRDAAVLACAVMGYQCRLVADSQMDLQDKLSWIREHQAETIELGTVLGAWISPHAGAEILENTRALTSAVLKVNRDADAAAVVSTERSSSGERLTAEPEIVSADTALLYRDLAEISSTDQPIIYVQETSLAAVAIILAGDDFSVVSLPALDRDSVLRRWRTIRSMDGILYDDDASRSRLEDEVRHLADALGPLVDALSGSERRIRLSPSGLLSSLPLTAALSIASGSTRSSPLVSLVPSIQAALPGPSRDVDGIGIVAHSDPAGRVGSIPGVLREAALVADLYGVARPAADPYAGTLVALTDALENRSVTHLACHLRFDEGDPAASRIVLQDGDHDLRSVLAAGRLNSNLVVLSGCSTGRNSRALPGEPLALASLLLSAGARSVVGTLWPVSDAEILRLVEVLHKSYLTHRDSARAVADILSSEVSLASAAAWYSVGL